LTERIREEIRNATSDFNYEYAQNSALKNQQDGAKNQQIADWQTAFFNRNRHPDSWQGGEAINALCSGSGRWRR